MTHQLVQQLDGLKPGCGSEQPVTQFRQWREGLGGVAEKSLERRGCCSLMVECFESGETKLYLSSFNVSLIQVILFFCFLDLWRK